MSAKRSKVDEEESEDEFIKLELEGFPPEKEDRDGIIQMLKQLFPKSANLYLGGLADYLISRNNIGTVVKYSDDTTTDDDDEDIVFSITSIFNLFDPAATEYPVLADLCKFLDTFVKSSKSPKSDVNCISNVINGTSSEKPALLINERYVNLPAEVAEKSVGSLLDEINALPDAERPTHLIVMTRAIQSPDSSELVYIQPEMENVRKFAKVTAETNVTISTADEDETITYVIMVVDVAILPEIFDSVASSST